MSTDLAGRVNELRGGKTGKLIARRMREFKDIVHKGNEEWFSELCYCVLTARSSAKNVMRLQEKIGKNGFLFLPQQNLTRKIRILGYKGPYKKKATYIVYNRKFRNIKEIINRIGGAKQAREWLVKNVKGIGYKEASHFLRNVGFDDVAILDRHVLSVLREYELIDEVPHSLTRGRYLGIEEKLVGLAEKLGLTLGELDLYLWYLKTGEVLK